MPDFWNGIFPWMVWAVIFLICAVPCGAGSYQFIIVPSRQLPPSHDRFDELWAVAWRFGASTLGLALLDRVVFPLVTDPSHTVTVTATSLIARWLYYADYLLASLTLFMLWQRRMRAFVAALRRRMFPRRPLLGRDG